MAKARLKRIIVPLLIGGLFVFLAGRIAFVHQYPMAYDEGYHYGLMQMYTEQLSPFVGNQPKSLDYLGSVQADGSHLYHYLLSFPLRLMEQLTQSELLYFWMLRAVSIGLGLVTLYLVYKLARRFTLPRFAAYAATFAIAITPVFYDISAHVNYDNLLLPLALLVLMAAWDFVAAAKRGVFSIGLSARVVTLCLAGTLVKYSFLPLAFAVLGLLAIYTLRSVGLRQAAQNCKTSLRRGPTFKHALLGVALLATGTFWLGTYGVNVARYHTPHPQCHVVLNVERCQNYGPWARNYALRETRDERPILGMQPFAYIKLWLHTMDAQLFTKVRLVAGGPAAYEQAQSLRIAYTAMVVGGLVCAAFVVRALRKTQLPWVLFAVAVGSYVLVLWGQNYSDFQNLHQPVAIQGRYLLPVLPVLYITLALGYALAFVRVRQFMHQARLAGAETYTAITRLALQKLYAAWLMVAVRISGATHPNGVRFIANI